MDLNHSRPGLWGFKTTVSLLMALHGLGIIVASFPVSGEPRYGPLERKTENQQRHVYKFKLEGNDRYNQVRKVEHREVIPLLKVACQRKDMSVQKSYTLKNREDTLISGLKNKL